MKHDSQLAFEDLALDATAWSSAIFDNLTFDQQKRIAALLTVDAAEVEVRVRLRSNRPPIVTTLLCTAQGESVMHTIDPEPR